MTPKEAYEAKRQPIRDQRMAEETAYAARMRRDAAADECITVMIDGIKAFFQGQATLHISSMNPGMGQSIRFLKDKPPQD